MGESAERLLLEDEAIERAERDSRTSPELRDRPDYESALETLRRFDRMVKGTEEPIRILRESTRGAWTRSRLAKV